MKYLVKLNALCINILIIILEYSNLTSRGMTLLILVMILQIIDFIGGD